MSRYYDVTFRKPDGSTITIRAQRNTQAAAERCARRKLMVGCELPRNLPRVSIEYVKEEVNDG